MKVWIRKPNNWFGPYQLAEKLMFWVPKEKDEYGFPRTADRVYNFGEWLAHGRIEHLDTMLERSMDMNKTLFGKFEDKK